VKSAQIVLTCCSPRASGLVHARVQARSGNGRGCPLRLASRLLAPLPAEVPCTFRILCRSSEAPARRACDSLPAMTELGSVAWPPAPVRTERLVLRAPEARDRAACIELLASPEVHTYLGGPHPA
jgi:hypothetical protein